jgi:anti-sigma regulatory factor (Ser/Thr protein kinase)
MTSATARVRAELAALGQLHSTLAAALESEGWTGEPVDRVLTASTEAMANAVEHGSAPGAGVDVAFEVIPLAARVRVLDKGRCGSQTPLREPEVPPVTSPRGRGRLLMRALAEETRVRRSGSGTQVLLVFDRNLLAA